MIDLNKIVRPNIVKLQAYSSARDEYTGSKGIFLDANENPFGTLNRYPDPLQRELKQKLSSLKKVETDSIFIGNGSDEVLDLAFRIFCNPGKDKALTFSPTYGMYEVSAAINNIELIKIPLTKNFQINTDNVNPYLEDANLKLIFICSPNNPTGNLINTKDIIYILKNCKGIVLLDEAYIDFTIENSLIQLIKKYPNLIIVQTFSKAYGLAASRVGVGYANKKIISLYNKVKPPYNVSTLNQKSALIALNNQSNVQENITLILKERELLKKSLLEIKLVKQVYPSSANFVLIEVLDVENLYKILVQNQIITRNRNNIISNCLRITIGTPQENKKLITVLKNI